MDRTVTEDRVVDAARSLDQDEFTRVELADKLDVEPSDLKQGVKAARKSGTLEKVRNNGSGKGLFRVPADASDA
jgi:DNA-binding transcriptional regulator LsrR (DeoR family)